MRINAPLLMIVSLGLLCWLTQSAGADFPPKPRPLPQLEDDCVRFTSPEFDRVLTQLKTERDALDAEWKTLSKQRSASKPTSDQAQRKLEELLKKTLDRLRQQENKKPAPLPLPEVEFPPKKTEPVAAKTPEPVPEPKTVPLPENTLPGGLDPLHLGNALFRLEKFDEALASFRLVDLKARKAEERAPIQFLMASCLLHLGKNEEAVELLREAANSRSDERTAGYAQWHLEMHRWQREINERLQDIRRRRIAAEKQP